MSEAKFTKGEWSVNNKGKLRKSSEHDDIEINHGVDGECVAEIVHELSDAYLIAAAPKMYEMLEQIHDSLALTGNVDDVNELLALARGEK